MLEIDEEYIKAIKAAQEYYLLRRCNYNEMTC